MRQTIWVRPNHDALGDVLSADTAVVVRHPVSLQSIDFIGQLLGHIAAVTRYTMDKGMIGPGLAAVSVSPHR